MAKSDVWVIRKADDQTLQISVVTNRRFDDIQLPPELSSELNIPTRGMLNTILNSVFMAGMQEEADNQLRKSIEAATEDVDRASQLLAERGIRARENICTCCNEEHEILYHAVGDPKIAICPRCQTLHKEAENAQAELPIVTPFDPKRIPYDDQGSGNPPLDPKAETEKTCPDCGGEWLPTGNGGRRCLECSTVYAPTYFDNPNQEPEDHDA